MVYRIEVREITGAIRESFLVDDEDLEYHRVIASLPYYSRKLAHFRRLGLEPVTEYEFAVAVYYSLVAYYNGFKPNIVCFYEDGRLSKGLE